MTLVGPHTAVISLGVSCQTSYQLHQNKELVSHLVGEPLEYESSFFNWLISDCRGIATFLRAFAGRGLAYGDIVRDDREEWRFEPLQVADHRIWLWHGKPCGETSDEDLAMFTAKYHHLARKLWALRAKRRRIFVVSNCQNNLDDTLARHCHLFQFASSPAEISSIEAAVHAAFPSGENRFIYAFYPDCTKDLAASLYHPMPRDGSAWEGSCEAWGELLRTKLPAALGSRAAWYPARRWLPRIFARD